MARRSRPLGSMILVSSTRSVAPGYRKKYTYISHLPAENPAGSGRPFGGLLSSRSPVKKPISSMYPTLGYIIHHAGALQAKLASTYSLQSCHCALLPKHHRFCTVAAQEGSSTTAPGIQAAGTEPQFSQAKVFAAAGAYLDLDRRIVPSAQDDGWPVFPLQTARVWQEQA